MVRFLGATWTPFVLFLQQLLAQQPRYPFLLMGLGIGQIAFAKVFKLLGAPTEGHGIVIISAAQIISFCLTCRARSGFCVQRKSSLMQNSAASHLNSENYFTAQGIILFRQVYQENDYILDILSATNYRFSALAKNARENR